MKHGVALGRDITLDALRKDYDAVFLGVGFGGTNKLGLAGEGELANVVDAVEYIARAAAGERSHASCRSGGGSSSSAAA